MSREKNKKSLGGRSPSLTIRFDEHIRAALDQQAERENRTVSNLVDTIIKEYLRSKGLLNGGAKADPTELSPAWSKTKRARTDAAQADK